MQRPSTTACTRRRRPRTCRSGCSQTRRRIGSAGGRGTPACRSSRQPSLCERNKLLQAATVSGTLFHPRMVPAPSAGAGTAPPRCARGPRQQAKRSGLRHRYRHNTLHIRRAARPSSPTATSTRRCARSAPPSLASLRPHLRTERAHLPTCRSIHTRPSLGRALSGRVLACLLARACLPGPSSHYTSLRCDPCPPRVLSCARRATWALYSVVGVGYDTIRYDHPDPHIREKLRTNASHDVEADRRCALHAAPLRTLMFCVPQGKETAADYGPDGRGGVAVTARRAV